MRWSFLQQSLDSFITVAQWSLILSKVIEANDHVLYSPTDHVV